MNNDNIFSQKCREELEKSAYWTNKTRDNDRIISNLICPVCGDGTAWAYSKKPYSINCNRQNNCGARTKVRELLDIQINYEQECPPTNTNPDAPATAYLKSRGLDRVLKGSGYKHWRKTRKGCGGAVMFKTVTPDGQEAWNGRLYSPPNKTGKTHNKGSSKGAYYIHPLMAEKKEFSAVYLTEGIIDALSIQEITGEPAIAVLSAGQDPAKVPLPAKFLGKLVLAFDNDSAGIAACRKWRQQYPDAEIILPDQGAGDWNELLQEANTSEKAHAAFRTNLSRYRCNGRLALAETARKYSEIFFEFYGKPAGIFTLHGKTWFASLARNKDKNGEPIHKIELVINATVKLIAKCIKNTDPDKPENSFQLEIKQGGKPAVQVTASGRNLAALRELKQFFLNVAGISFDGSNVAANSFTSLLTNSKAPEVEQMEITGYQEKSGLYIFPGWGVNPAGRLIYPDSKGHFRLGAGKFCRAATHETHIIKPDENGNPAEIYRLLTDAFGDRGAVGLAWMTAALFVHQIKAKINFFPFLSFYGEPASGKTALTTILNSMAGMDQEGIPITGLNSSKGIARTMSRTSLPTALLEDNKRNSSNFDYSIILPAYNRNPLQIQAAFTGDNKTVERPFPGSLLFVQNLEPFESQAEKERAISIEFKVDEIRGGSATAYDRLIAIPKQQRAHIIQAILGERHFFEQQWPEKFAEAKGDMDEITSHRIRDNYALILGWHRLLCLCFKIEYSLHSYLLEGALKKVKTSQLRDYTLADQFFEAIHNVDNDSPILDNCCHPDKDKGILFVNYPATMAALNSTGVFLDKGTDKTFSKHPAYIEHSKLYRFPDNKPRRCFVFDREKLRL